MTHHRQLKDSETLLFIGDSITDCGRSDHSKFLGNGYVRLVNDMLVVRQPEKRINVINRGISGHTVYDLRNRWHEDVISNRPDWLSVKIGINDLNRFLVDKANAHLGPDEYIKVYDQLLALTKSALPDTEILLISPFLITTDNIQGSHRQRSLDLLQKYIAAVQSLSEKYKTRYLNLHNVFQQRLKKHHPDVYCPEPVHPNPTGHLVIAEEVYRALTLS